MILIDTSVWIDYFNGTNTWQTNLVDNLLSDVPVIMGDLILAEILQGFRRDQDFNVAKDYLSTLPQRTMGGHTIAVQSAQNYRTLRKKGTTVRKTIDVIIATFCIEEGLTLLHNDHDFDPMVQHLNLPVMGAA
ncbi:MAG: PIN domain nuclease [Deltaproteobacteria bacterium]|nr:PIN domain nuclease [Deltaproteobacteria bacterium]